MPLHEFSDPDAFYHAAISDLIWKNGSIKSFPWLDLTTLGNSFADHHFLFHYLLAPMQAAFGSFFGLRLVAVLGASLLIVISYACLRWLRVNYALAWTTLFAVSAPLLIRLLLGKATPYALILFVLGLTAVWKRKPWLCLLVGFIFALTHGGWVILLGSVGLLALGETFHRRIIDGRSWMAALKESAWREVSAVIVGSLLGILIHPNFPNTVSFLWIQVVKIGLGTSTGNLVMGNEWSAVRIIDLLPSMAPWLVVLLISLAGLAFAARRPLNRDVARAVTAFTWPMGAIFLLTLKSRRNAEYLIPAIFLWLPWFWNLIEPPRLLAVFQSAFTPIVRKLVYFVVIVAGALLVADGGRDTYSALRSGIYPDNVYRETMAPISERAQSNDRVFHSDWDEFPPLFMIDNRLRYIAGLDPTFLYEASSTLSIAYQELSWRPTSKELAWDLIHDRLQSRFVFIDKRDHAKLFELIKSDSRYEMLAEAEDSASFEVKP